MNFHYKVRDPKGKVLEGELDAPNLEAASQQLRQDGFSILELDNDNDDSDDEGVGLFPRRISRLPQSLKVYRKLGSDCGPLAQTAPQKPRFPAPRAAPIAAL